MKQALAILILFYSETAHACSYVPWSFCHTCDQFQLNPVISGIITDTVSHGIRLSVIGVFRGLEQRDTITIWDGTDFDCNGPFSMAAKGLGHIYGEDTTIIGDTVIVVLPAIDSIENTWDVIGDYRRPDYFGYEPAMWVKDDTIRGYISGPHYASLPFAVFKMDYSSFKAHWFSNNLTCSDLVEIIEIGHSTKIYPSVVNDKLMIETNEADYSITIFSEGGIMLKEKNKTDNWIDMSRFSPGLYVVELKIHKDIERKKIIKL